MYYKPNWERIGVTSTWRMKTPSGWLVFDDDSTGGLCYVPDPGHDWKFLPEEEPKDEQA